MINKKDALKAIEEAMKPKQNDDTDVAAGSINDLIKALHSEPNAKKRQKLIKDFTARHNDTAVFLAENVDLINAEAEAALIGAAVGGTVEEKEISYKGGRRHIIIKKKQIAPNQAALSMLLKNRMPDKYSDKPQTEIEVEDVSEIEEALYGSSSGTEDTEKEDDTV